MSHHANGHPVSLINAKGDQRTFTYENAGNLTSITNAEGNKVEFTNIDIMGNPLAVKDPRGNISTRTYNAKGWLLSVANALGHTTRYDYDKVGNALKATDPIGGIVSYTYDALNQLTDPGHDSPAGPVHIVTQYTYDNDGRIATNVDGNGNVLSGIYGSASDGLNGLLRQVIRLAMKKVGKDTNCV